MSSSIYNFVDTIYTVHWYNVSEKKLYDTVFITSNENSSFELCDGHCSSKSASTNIPVYVFMQCDMNGKENEEIICKKHRDTDCLCSILVLISHSKDNTETYIVGDPSEFDEHEIVQLDTIKSDIIETLNIVQNSK
jgi:hypothetical protein